MEKETGKIMKVSRYSYGAVLPKKFVKKLKWKEKQKIVFGLGSESIMIKDWKKQ
jgi:antitoxin component of MazEF toxin-antitoxin module